MWLSPDSLNHKYYQIFSAHKHLLHLIPLPIEICLKSVARLSAFHLGMRIVQNS